MNARKILRWPRWVAVLAAVALIAVTVAALPRLRDPILRAAGWALVVSEPVASADIIVITLDFDGAGTLEAADLVQSGVAKRVAVFIDPPLEEDKEFVRRGLPYDDAGARQISQLRSLGVTDIVRVAPVDGSQAEGLVLPPWCDEHQFRTVVLVTNKDHSRRLRREFDRVMKGHSTIVKIQPSRYSNFDPDRWWQSRSGVRTEIVEAQKLLLDFLLHPF